MKSKWIDSINLRFTTNPREMERYAHVILFSFLFLFPFSLFFGFGSANASFELVQKQKEILQKLSQSLPTSLSTRQWNTTNPNPCHWSGVGCSNASPSTVTGLSLSGLGLRFPNTSSSSTFFGLLCRLDSLESLDLSENFFAAMPKSFFSGCSGLKSLNISYNSLNGSLPSFSGFRSLESLDLSFNYLEGDVDSQLDGLEGLKSFNLSGNAFNGTIQAAFSGRKFPSLEALVLSINSFVGEIPAGIFSYKNLTLLDLSQNKLNGSVPGGIERLSKLENLLLSSNNFIGEIPPVLATIKSLSRFAAHQNQFSSSIPSGITKYLKVLDLSFNRLTGKIPSDLLSPTSLVFVDLTNNQLEGSIPKNLSPNLHRLRLGGNSLTGSIPLEIGGLSGLMYLELDGNHLNESIPSQLGNCKNLTLLNLAFNQLQGNLPKDLGGLRQLVELKLQGNNLGGGIPDEFFKLGYLITLNLSRNSLTGQIPSAISSLKNLQVLNLQINEFDGSIPNTTSALTYLMELQLGDNKLSGTIPNLPNSLTMLNLTGNLFNGSIPSSLQGLSNLEILDISNNKFSGKVPDFLTQIRSLVELVLSNNQLSGVLPKFPSYVTVISSGNQLVNSTTYSKPTMKRKTNSLFIIIAIISALIGLGLVAAILLIVSKQFYRVKDEGIQAGGNLPRVVNGCFITANNIHRSSIDFNKTMEIVGNPDNIIMKTRFSTYYKAIMPNGVSYSVKKLNWTDKIFQMGRHERFGQELEDLGRLSSSNVMVPLAYVLTEDSAYLFYEHVHKGTVFDFLHKGSENALDWPSRYSIALGVAQGLTFLHGCNQPVTLIDLSTKSVHLKSVKEPQMGDIELCKVIDPSKSTGNLSTVAGSAGYIPPEYAYTMRVTVAGNVYSFGVILLELLTGKPPVNEGIELAKWALSHSATLEEREKILDSRICKASLAVHNQMLSVLKVALACVSTSPEARPKTRNVLRMLFNAS